VTGPLAGCRVLVTRERPGELAALLEASGATAVHVPLVQVLDPVDAGAALRRELDRLAGFDWLVVTSAAGAERVASAAAAVPSVRLAAVGTTTARVLADTVGRPVDVVPATQNSQSLLDELLAVAEPAQRFLVAQADRADDTLASGLRRAGHQVTSVVAYRTVLRAPDPGAVEGADAVLFTSGSAALSWFDAFGGHTPPIVVSIGPTTTAVAERLGLKVTCTAADHSLGGLVAELARVVGGEMPGDGAAMTQSSGRIHPAK